MHLVCATVIDGIFNLVLLAYFVTVGQQGIGSDKKMEDVSISTVFADKMEIRVSFRASSTEDSFSRSANPTGTCSR